MNRLAFIFLLLIPVTALGDDTVPPEPLIDIRTHTFGDGITFVCFTENDSRNILLLRLQFTDIKNKLAKYEEWITVKTKQISKLEEANGYLGSTVDAYRSETILLKAALEASDAWYRNPYVWFSVGIIVGGGVGAAIFYAAKGS